MMKDTYIFKCLPLWCLNLNSLTGKCWNIGFGCRGWSAIQVGTASRNPQIGCCYLFNTRFYGKRDTAIKGQAYSLSA